jgi:hypothetical protein
LWRRPRPKLGCGAKERRRTRRKKAMHYFACRFFVYLIRSDSTSSKAGAVTDQNATA